MGSLYFSFYFILVLFEEIMVVKFIVFRVVIYDMGRMGRILIEKKKKNYFIF